MTLYSNIFIRFILVQFFISQDISNSAIANTQKMYKKIPFVIIERKHRFYQIIILEYFSKEIFTYVHLIRNYFQTHFADFNAFYIYDYLFDNNIKFQNGLNT